MVDKLSKYLDSLTQKNTNTTFYSNMSFLLKDLKESRKYFAPRINFNLGNVFKLFFLEQQHCEIRTIAVIFNYDVIRTVISVLKGI